MRKPVASKAGAGRRRPPYTLLDPSIPFTEGLKGAASESANAAARAFEPGDMPARAAADSTANGLADAAGSMDAAAVNAAVYIYDAARKDSFGQRLRRAFSVSYLLDPSTLYFSDGRAKTEPAAADSPAVAPAAAIDAANASDAFMAAEEVDCPATESTQSAVQAASVEGRVHAAASGAPTVKFSAARRARRKRMSAQTAGLADGAERASGNASAYADAGGAADTPSAGNDTGNSSTARKRSRFRQKEPVYRPLHTHRTRESGGRVAARRASVMPLSYRLFPILLNLLLIVIILFVGAAVLLMINLERDGVRLASLGSLISVIRGDQDAYTEDGNAPDDAFYSESPDDSYDEALLDDPYADSYDGSADTGELPADDGSEYLYDDTGEPVEIDLPPDMTPIPIDAPTPSPVPVLDREMTEDEKLAAFIYEGKDRFYTRDELIYRSEEELAMIRNGMYALSGKIFERNMEAKEFFENCSWYEGTTASDSSAMSEFTYYQLQNLQLIVIVEKDKGFRSR